MCINYIPTTKAVLVEYFGVDDPRYDWKEEVWQDYQAPILIQRDGRRQALIASYGLVPKRKVQPGCKHYATMNARAETVGEKPMAAGPSLPGANDRFLRALLRKWQGRALVDQHGRRHTLRGCRHLAGMAGGTGLHLQRLPTHVNADTHPLQRRMHKPGDEQWSLVIGLLYVGFYGENEHV